MATASNRVERPIASTRRDSSRLKSLSLASASLLLSFALVASSAFAAPPPPTFSEPEIVTDGATRYRLSRSTTSSTGFDDAGVLHAAYWSGFDGGTSPAFPSFVYHRTWTRQTGWSAATIVDDSEDGLGAHVGGREPSLAFDQAGGVWVAWHDHRHSTALGNWIDNLEIYADYLPEEGAFSSSDIRLTNTSAGGAGDNGYTARLAAGPDGATHVAWFDFHFDGNVSDIFLKKSDASGIFDLGETMADMRLTDLADRGGMPAYATPDLAVDHLGFRHLVWTTGFGGGGDIYYGQLAVGATTASETLLAPGSGDFFDPPRVVAASNGDVWVAFGDDAGPGGNENVTLMLREVVGRGVGSFGAPIPVTSDPGRQYAPDLEVDSAGMVHLAWLDRRGGQRHIYYGVFDPNLGALAFEVQVTTESAEWDRPALSLNGDGDVFLLFERNAGPAAGDLWFATTIAPLAADGAWERFQ